MSSAVDPPCGPLFHAHLLVTFIDKFLPLAGGRSCDDWSGLMANDIDIKMRII
jgi:hypothetical protein